MVLAMGCYHGMKICHEILSTRVTPQGIFFMSFLDTVFPLVMHALHVET